MEVKRDKLKSWTQEEYSAFHHGIDLSAVKVMTRDRYDQIGRSEAEITYKAPDFATKKKSLYNYANPERGTYRILMDMGNMAKHVEDREYKHVYKNGTVIDVIIPTIAQKIGPDKNHVYVIMSFLRDLEGAHGKIRINKNREATIKDLVALTGYPRKTVSGAMKQLDEVGLVRGYYVGREKYYRLNPIYWNQEPYSKTPMRNYREIDYIDYILFRDELEEVMGTYKDCIALRELATIAFYKLFPDELEKLPREADIAAAEKKAESIFDFTIETPKETEKAVTPKTEDLFDFVPDTTTPKDAALIDSVDFYALMAAPEKKEPAAPVAPVEHVSITDDLTDEERARIYDQYILHHKDGAPYNYIYFDHVTGRDGKAIDVAKVTRTIDPSRDMYYQINADSTAFVVRKCANNDIDTVNAWFVDIDAGKDDKGNYLSGLALAEKKAYFRDVIATLPAPTAVVETRNGYHVYWSIKDDARHDVGSWKRIEDILHTRVRIMDPKVKDISRILRAPGTTWNKPSTGLPAYPVSIVSASEVSYNAESLTIALEENAARMNSAIETYYARYPEDREENKKKANAVRNIKGNANKTSVPKVAVIPGHVSPIHDANPDIIEKIRAGIPVHVAGYDHLRIVDDIYDEIKRVDIAAFLGIDTPHHFRDLLHVDNNPSAYIARDNNNPDHYLYCCASASSPASAGWDLANLVEWIQNTDKKHARRYLQKCLLIKGRAKKLQKVG